MSLRWYQRVLGHCALECVRSEVCSSDFSHHPCEIPHTHAVSEEVRKSYFSPYFFLVGAESPPLSGLNRIHLWIYESYYEGAEGRRRREGRKNGEMDFRWSDATTKHVQAPSLAGGWQVTVIYSNFKNGPRAFPHERCLLYKSWAKNKIKSFCIITSA